MALTCFITPHKKAYKNICRGTSCSECLCRTDLYQSARKARWTSVAFLQSITEFEPGTAGSRPSILLNASGPRQRFLLRDRTLMSRGAPPGQSWPESRMILGKVTVPTDAGNWVGWVLVPTPIPGASWVAYAQKESPQETLLTLLHKVQLSVPLCLYISTIKQ